MTIDSDVTDSDAMHCHHSLYVFYCWPTNPSQSAKWRGEVRKAVSYDRDEMFKQSSASLMKISHVGTGVAVFLQLFIKRPSRHQSMNGMKSWLKSWRPD